MRQLSVNIKTRFYLASLQCLCYNHILKTQSLHIKCVQGFIKPKLKRDSRNAICQPNCGLQNPVEIACV
uniref:Uncharacterized protein n=1 Tax=Anguilla anguilla TaxID=7936 RepID=A0A0E9X0P6_ANGAN